MQTALDIILTTDCFGVFSGDGGHAKMTVVARSFAKGVELADIRNGVAAEEVCATTDAKRLDLTQWHQGASAEEVYFEVYTAAGRKSHGWIDAETRKLVQAG